MFATIWFWIYFFYLSRLYWISCIIWIRGNMKQFSWRSNRYGYAYHTWCLMFSNYISPPPLPHSDRYYLIFVIFQVSKYFSDIFKNLVPQGMGSLVIKKGDIDVSVYLDTSTFMYLLEFLHKFVNNLFVNKKTNFVMQSFRMTRSMALVSWNHIW